MPARVTPGLADTERTADLVGKALGISPDEILVASTGVIGQRLDMDKVKKAIPGLKETLTPAGIPMAAQAIMTTDSFPKTSSFDGTAENRPYRISGLAKGAGMIMPNMATMLCFILTDIQIAPEPLQKGTFRFPLKKPLTASAWTGIPAPTIWY